LRKFKYLTRKVEKTGEYKKGTKFDDAVCMP